MKTHIINYRGWEITFDTDAEIFSAYSNSHDMEVQKSSYASIKKYIDDFIKDNQNFKPFYVINDPTTYISKKGKIKIIGIRKDGAFVGEDSKGEKFQVSKYDDDRYMLVNETFDMKAFMHEYEKMGSEIQRLTKIREAFAENMKSEHKTLAILKKEFVNENSN